MLFKITNLGFAINTHKYTLQTPQRQAFQPYTFITEKKPKKKSYQSKINPTECDAFKKNPVVFIKTMHRHARHILNVIIAKKQQLMINDDPDLFISQDYIAKASGFKSRRTAMRWLDKLFAWGVIGKINRPFQTCVYSINGCFLNEWMREQLKDTLSALAEIEPQMLKRITAIRAFRASERALPHGFFSSTVTLFNINENIYIKKLSNLSSLSKLSSVSNISSLSNSRARGDEETGDGQGAYMEGDGRPCVSSLAFLDKNGEKGKGEPTRGGEYDHGEFSASFELDEDSIMAIVNSVLAQNTYSKKPDQRYSRSYDGYDSRFTTLSEQRSYSRSPFAQPPKSKTMAEMIAHNKRMREQCS